ncbi:MAG TPA: hypothetical protein P5277_02920 [Candidatus Paceibacterota bacterium]|nr:hypothetical protein [Candidatus Paceibacterota bacterium]
MAKILIAQTRLFKNVFLCKKCNAKIRMDPKKILSGKVQCRRCKGTKFRAVKKDK